MLRRQASEAEDYFIATMGALYVCVQMDRLGMVDGEDGGRTANQCRDTGAVDDQDESAAAAAPGHWTRLQAALSFWYQ